MPTCYLLSFAAYVSHMRYWGQKDSLAALHRSFDYEPPHRPYSPKPPDLSPTPPQSVPSAPARRRVEYAPLVRLPTPAKEKQPDPGSVPLID